MKKVSKILLPTIYLGVIGVMVVSVVLVLSGIQSYLNEYPNYQYTLDNVFSEYVVPVAALEQNNPDTIIKPYISENVKIGKYFYDFESDANKQIDSLILYEGTYMQNNGVDYVENDPFDIVAILPGEVISVEDNEVYGKVITIKHNDNLKSVYSNVTDVLVSVGYQVSIGEVIASSNKPKINSDYEEMLHFEVYYKENPIDPESLYTLSVSNFQ